MFRTTLLAFVFTLAAAFGFTSRSIADGSPITFQVSNQQTDPLGQVTVSTPDGDYYVSVPDENTYSVQIPETAISVTINGQIVPQGIKAIVHLQSGKGVAVLWSSPSLIQVIDEDAIL